MGNRKSKDAVKGDDRQYRNYPDRKERPHVRGFNGKSGRKDPRLACLLSLIVPGGGQVYLRRDVKGISFFLCAAAGYSVGGFFLYRAFTGDSSKFKTNMAVFGVMFMVGIIFHVVAVVEAYTDAKRINQQYYNGDGSENPYDAELVVE